MHTSIRCWLLIGCFVGLLSASASSQEVRVGVRKVTQNTAVSSLTVSASPAFVSFQLRSGGIATGSSAVAVTTTWGATLCVLTCTIRLYGYFSSATAALSGGLPVANIPSSSVLGQVP